MAEALLTAPQIVVAAKLIAEGKKECENIKETLDDQAGESGATRLVLVVSSVLFIHAVHVIATPRTSHAAAPASPKVGFVPLLVTEHETAPGFTVGVSF